MSRSESRDVLKLKKKQFKPLSTVQAYLIATKTCIILLRDLCIELKDLLIILTLILFFAIGVYEAVKHLFR